LRKERRLRVSENRVKRRIFGPRRDEVTGEGIKFVLLLSTSSVYTGNVSTT
jgi:hypothetical protein